jgi:hypothetical protein
MLFLKSAISVIVVTNTIGQNMGQPYCSESNRAFWSQFGQYNGVFRSCSDGTGNYPQVIDAPWISTCVGGFITYYEPIDPECTQCWVDLVLGMFALPPAQQAECVADPTSTECVYGEVNYLLAAFETCSGMIPVAYDKPAIDVPAPASLASELTPTRFALLAILPILLLIH